jgi:uroporphyrinogen-III synthase
MPAMIADQSPIRSGAVWITRAEPGASATAARVADLGFEPIVAPLLRFYAVEGAVLDLAPEDVLAFTSVNGVTCAAALTDRRDLKVFAVGDTTAGAARAAGFADVTSARGDVEALSTLIVQSRPAGGVIHAAAVDTAGDMVGVLQRAGISARKTAVYRTEAAKALPETVSTASIDGSLSAVLVHSPRAGTAGAALLMQGGQSLSAVAAVGLSKACLAPLYGLGFRKMAVAETPDETALMNALLTVIEQAPDGR